MPKPKNKALVAFIPVLHQGYINFFKHFSKLETLYIIGSPFLSEESYLRKDIRTIPAENMASILHSSSYFRKVEVLTESSLKNLDKADQEIIMPDEDISRTIAKKIKKANTTFYPVFLRWDRQSVEAPIDQTVDEKITEGAFAKSIMQEALAVAEVSSDIWRRVGAILITKDRQKSVAANKGEPHAHSPWMEGDPRNVFHKGIGIEMSVYSHAEATLIAEAAKRGISLLDASIYVSTFPCPACAKLIAHSGIKNCFYKDGYAVLDGKRVMEQYNVHIVRVLLDEKPKKGPEWVPYPESST